jgi:glycerol-3-phosphate responsive antiterminator
LNKLYKDYISLYQYITNNKNRDIDNIKKSLNTILFVLKENIKIINNIIDIIKNKKIELQEDVSLFNFLLKN